MGVVVMGWGIAHRLGFNWAAQLTAARPDRAPAKTKDSPLQRSKPQMVIHCSQRGNGHDAGP